MQTPETAFRCLSVKEWHGVMPGGQTSNDNLPVEMQDNGKVCLTACFPTHMPPVCDMVACTAAATLTLNHVTRCEAASDHRQ